MPPPPFCIHCRQPVHADPNDSAVLVHARSGNPPCADGKNDAELVAS